MNPQIQRRFERLETKLRNTSAVQQYHLLQRDVAQYSGQVRARATLADGGLVELFEHAAVNPNGEIEISKYRYHWQDASGNVIRRWDNAMHHPGLPHAPHHVHMPDGSVEGVAEPPDAMAVLAHIEAELGQE